MFPQELLEIFFSRICLNCEKINQTNSPLCLYCQPEAVIDPTGRCIKCFEPCTGTHSKKAICEPCKNNPPVFGALRYCWHYQTKTAAILKSMKARPSKKLAGYLTAAAINLASEENFMEGITAVIAAPLSYKSRQQRLFNQSAILAQGLAKHYKLKFIPNAVKNLTSKGSQKDRTKIERFAANKYNITSRKKLLGHSKILLVDDIITTGATINGIASCLRNELSCEVKALALAKTPLRSQPSIISIT